MTALAVEMNVSPALAATVDINGADQVVAADPAAVPAITFTTNHTATINDAINITGVALGTTTITAGTAGFGTLVFLGTTTVNTTAVGSGTAIGSITGGAATKTVTINGTVNMAGALTVSSTGTITLAGALTNSGTVTFAGNGTLNLNGATSSVTGAVTTATNNTGTLVVGGAGSSFGADIGTSSLALLKFQLNNTGTTTASGNVFAPVEFSADGTLSVATTKAITGAVTTTVANTGTLTFAGTTTTGGQIGATGARLKAVNFGGSVSIANNVFATNVNVTAGTATLTANRTVETAGGGVNMSGTSSLALGAFSLTNSSTTGNFTVANTPSLTLTIGATQGTSGQVVLTGGGTSAFSNTGTLTITPTVSGTSILNGQIYKVVTGGAAAATGGTLTAGGSTLLLSWTARVATAADATRGDRFGGVVTANNDIVLVAALASASSVPGVTSTAAGAVDAIAGYSGTNTGVQSLQAVVQSLTTASDLNTAGIQLSPDAAGGGVLASLAAASQVAGVVDGRADDLRVASSGAGTGVSTGEAMKGLDIWAQGFGSDTDQDTRDSIDGYDARTWGGVMGVDFRVADDWRLGVAGSYAATDVDEKNSANGTDIDSYGGTVYANWFGEPWYLDAALGYTRHAYDGTRVISFPGFAGTAKGDYDGNQYSARVDAGYPLHVDDIIITPNVSLAFSRLDQDGYTETGAAGANLTVNSIDHNSLRSGLGVKAGYVFVTDDGKLIPELSVKWVHEFMDADAPDVTSAFAGGTTFRSAGMSQPRDSGVVGAALNFLSTSNLELGAKYDSEIKSDFISHVGRVQVKYRF